MARNVNMGVHPYNDMKIGIVERDKVNATYLVKLDAEYNKLSSKQQKLYWITNSVSSD